MALYDMSDADILRLPLSSVPTPTTLVLTSRDATTAVANIMRSLQNYSVLGFDIEVKPRFVKGVAPKLPSVMQIATSQQVYVFHLKKIAACFSQHGLGTPIQQALQILQPVLNSEGKTVYKCGVGLQEDLKLLQSFAPSLRTRDFVCMQRPAEQAGFRRPSLRVLTAILLRLQLSKEQQLSDWGQAHLTAAQVEYAATDAWVSREIAIELQSLGYLRFGSMAMSY